MLETTVSGFPPLTEDVWKNDGKERGNGGDKARPGKNPGWNSTLIMKFGKGNETVGLNSCPFENYRDFSPT
jgi:hypothetical protein